MKCPSIPFNCLKPLSVKCYLLKKKKNWKIHRFFYGKLTKQKLFQSYLNCPFIYSDESIWLLSIFFGLNTGILLLVSKSAFIKIYFWITKLRVAFYPIMIKYFNAERKGIFPFLFTIQLLNKIFLSNVKRNI